MNDNTLDRGFFRARERFNPVAGFDALRDVPMVLVRGELSDLLSQETQAEMGTRNPAMSAVTVPRVGHAPTLDEPEARAAIDAMLAAI